ncbi:family 16 glycosylhydrolase [Novosphingobium sp. NBM11]|uniref:glycoside hydrolase family 16 protein n=1 Tax=Novosphingobium sp. NBM11 TaxID=2596914 RepID=UPI0018920D2B|nr:glycoside hydrolase family 16 protein [Novosphingobium sp. NBM11]
MASTLLKITAILAPAGALALYSASASAPTIDKRGFRLVFDEEFDKAPSFYDATNAPDGRWKTNYFFGVQDINHPIGWGSRTIEGNKEMQYYAPPVFGVASPFEWKDGVLTIVARPNPNPSDSRTHGLPYISGLITTEKSFSAATGYFEARLALPSGKGLWPAFWLLPVPRMENGNPMEPGKQELDVMESVSEPGRIYHTVFTDDQGNKVKDGSFYDTGSDLTQYHTYGVKVTDTEIVWYFDDREVRRVSNVDFKRPAYMLLNLAVGGEWPGAPDKTTRFPAHMKIDWVRAYALP